MEAEPNLELKRIYMSAVYWEEKLLTFMFADVNSILCSFVVNTLRTDDADLRFYITTVQDG